MVPGIIIDVDDPLKIGRIKCAAPGLFDTNTMDEDVLPWIMPIQMNKYQMFSKPEKNRKVWILDNKDNPNEYWYLPMFDMTNITDSLVKEKYDNDIEVIMSRPTPSNSAQISYDNQDGIIVHYDDWKWNMTPDGNITCHGNDSDIDMKSGVVTIGKNSQGDYKYVTMAEPLESLFGKMASLFSELVNASNGSETGALKPWFMELQNICQKASTGGCPNNENFQAKNVKVN